MQEGTAALAGYGRIFRETVALTGVVPQISVVSGASAGGGAYSPALTDLIVMTEDAAMFLTGPGVVREALGEEIDAVEPRRPARARAATASATWSSATSAAAARARARAAGLSAVGGRAAAAARPMPLGPEIADPGAVVPAEPRRVYDVRDALRGDRRRGLDARAVPALGAQRGHGAGPDRGRPVGIVANQPRHLGGVLDAEGSEKAARFVDFCNSFGVPLIAVVDTPGFMPGSKQERAGVIRHGASLVRAFAAARVPKLTVVLRKSYGGAYITMNSRDLGADLVLAWPDAELGIMSARGAVGVVHRRELLAADDVESMRDAAGRRILCRAPAGRDGGRVRVRRRARRAGRDARAAGVARCGRCRRRPPSAVILEGKRLVITGVITKDSIAWHAASRALEEGASIVLTSFGRARRMTERAAQRLPAPRLTCWS